MLEKCPKCNGGFFSASNKNIGGGYPVKVVSCSGCGAVLGTLMNDQMQEMIEIIYQKISKLR